jgi:Na+/melibiose symporter-like transporter
MEKLDIAHHKIIMTALMLFIFITLIVFGVKLQGATQGTEGMQIITFALSFLSVILLFIVFSQVVHLRDEVSQLRSRGVNRTLAPEFASANSRRKK